MDRRLGITGLIHENFGIVMTYALSMPTIKAQLDTNFLGEFKYLWESFSRAQMRAERALIEFAMQLRALDDLDYGKELSASMNDRSFGSLLMDDNAVKDLNLRDVTNKIIHSGVIDWQLGDVNDPKVICHAPDDREKWISAEVQLLTLWPVVGNMMF